MSQFGFYFDSSKCTGCKTCHIACKDRMVGKLRPQQNGMTSVEAMPGMIWRRVTEFGGGAWVQNHDGSYSQNVFAYYLSIGCNHCEKPACTAKCPTKAMHKREDGLVIVDQQKCIGCSRCAKACPYDAPQLDRETRTMTKCDACVDQWQLANGQMTGKPICVAACPLRALDFDTMANLQAKYGQGNPHVTPLPAQSKTLPNLILKANPNAMQSSASLGKVLNIREI